MFPKGNVTISIEEYEELLDSHLKFLYLQNGGVDNWTWYSDSMPSEDEVNEYIKSKLKGKQKHG